MNEITEDLSKKITENKFNEALSLVENLLDQNSELHESDVDLIEKVFYHQSKLEFDLRYQFLNSLFEKNITREHFLEDTLSKSSLKQKFYLYHITKSVYLRSGKLEKLESLFYLLKKEYLNLHSYSILLREVTELEDAGLEGLLTEVEVNQIKYGLGDTDYFNERYSNAIELGQKPFETNYHKVNFFDNVWRKQTFAVKDRVLFYKDLTTPDDAKEFLKGVFELLIVGEEIESTLILLMNYACKFSNKDLGDLTYNFLNKEFRYENKSLIKKIESINHVDREEIDNIDLGEDLFNTEVNPDDVTVSRLVKQINLLRNEQNFNGATKLLEELKEIDEDHSLVKELEEKEHSKLGSSVKVYKKSIEEIEADLLKELSLFTTNNSEDIEQIEHLKRVCKKFVELNEIDYLRAQASYLVYTFNSFEFYSISIILLDTLIDEESENIPEVLSYLYMKCETLRLSENYYGALNEVEQLMDKFPLTDNEKTSFLYIKGEVLRALGRKGDALRVFSKVAALNKNFRMVQERLKEIE